MALALHNYDIHVEFTYRKPNLAILVDIHKSVKLIYLYDFIDIILANLSYKSHSKLGICQMHWMLFMEYHILVSRVDYCDIREHMLIIIFDCKLVNLSIAVIMIQGECMT